MRRAGLARHRAGRAGWARRLVGLDALEEELIDGAGGLEGGCVDGVEHEPLERGLAPSK